MLLIAAGLTLRDLMTIQRVNPGIQTSDLVSYRADAGFDKFPLTMSPVERQQRTSAFWTVYEDRIKAIPGVIAVGGGGTFPLNEVDPWLRWLVRENRPLAAGTQPPRIGVRFASPDYFRTLGQPLVAGRTFTASDTTDGLSVAIVNQSAAKPVLAGRRSDRHADPGRPGAGLVPDDRRRRR